MALHWNWREHRTLCLYTVKWLAIVVPMAAVVGSAVALFLWLLDLATNTRHGHPWLLYLLPLAGVAIALMYHHLGRESEAGNNLIMEQIHEPGGGVPWRMAPLVLVGTVVTHLFGGSAGREGTAVQMGGSLAQLFARPLRLSRDDVRVLLSCGVAAGFGAVFGTPLAGAIFALEVVAIGRMRYEALIPCLMASLLGDATCTWWGIGHTHYEVALPEGLAALPFVRPDLATIGTVILCGILFGLASVLFAELSHGLSAFMRRVVRLYWLRPVIGGVLVIALTWIVGTRAYLGLGVYPPPGETISIVGAFQADGVTPWSWLWKLLFTVVTLSCGFKGGEVTPLFFIGAALGHTLGNLFGLPVDLMAALGFVAVFAGATNTPLACTIMGVELFGAAWLPHLAIACFVAYLFSGHSGIYGSQRLGGGKWPLRLEHDEHTIRSLRESRRHRDQDDGGSAG